MKCSQYGCRTAGVTESLARRVGLLFENVLDKMAADWKKTEDVRGRGCLHYVEAAELVMRDRAWWQIIEKITSVSWNAHFPYQGWLESGRVHFSA